MFEFFVQSTIPRWKQIQSQTYKLKINKENTMITTKGLINKARREKKLILETEGLTKEFKSIERRYHKLGIELYLYLDSCPELLGSAPI